jgi:HSP20 family protein
MRRDPFLQDLVDFRRSFDDLFSRFLEPTSRSWSSEQISTAWLPPVETYIDQNKYHIRLGLAGVEPKDVNIEVHGNELYVSGERKRENQVSDEKYMHREFSYGSFQRVVPLPEGIDNDKVEANYNNGVLEITAPLSQKALPRRIEVKSISGGKEASRKVA